MATVAEPLSLFYPLHPLFRSPCCLTDDSSTTSSHKSVELINKLAPLVKPMVLEWEQISCIYNTAKGSKNVLTVSVTHE